MKRGVVLFLVLTTSVASADQAADYVKEGLELYRTGKYVQAARTLQLAYDLDQKPDTLFALAQAERLAGDCKTAIPHYRKVIERVADFNVAKLVQQNLSLCGVTEEPTPVPAQTPPAPNPDPEPPRVITRTVEVNRVDKLAALCLGAGALSLGAAGGLFVASRANRDAAEVARTLGDHDELADRASTQRAGAMVAAGAGVALIGIAIYRWTRSDEPSPSGVAVVPAEGGGLVSFTTQW